jgi:hypothetical protein
MQPLRRIAAKVSPRATSFGANPAQASKTRPALTVAPAPTTVIEREFVMVFARRSGC